MEKINDYKYKLNDRVITITPINSIIDKYNDNSIIDISKFYLDDEFIAKIYIDVKYKETVLDCEKHWSQFDYIEKLIKWLYNNNPDIYNHYANFSSCTYLKIEGYID